MQELQAPHQPASIEQDATPAPPSRGRGPSWAAVVGIALSSVGLKVGVDHHILLPDSPASHSIIEQTGRFSISATEIQASDPVSEKVCRLALELIDKHPACAEARAFFTSGVREIIIREKESRDGLIELGSYRPFWDSTLYLNQKAISGHVHIAAELGIPEADRPLFASLLIAPVICHEAAHATQDRELDKVAEASLGRKRDLLPSFIEDEMLCRLKELAINREFTQLADIVFPEISSHTFVILSSSYGTHSVIGKDGLNPLQAYLTGTLKYDDPSANATDPALQSWQLKHEPALAESVRSYYNERLAGLSATLTHELPQPTSGTVAMAFTLIGQRDMADSRVPGSLMRLSALQDKLGDSARIDRVVWDDIVGSCAANIPEGRQRSLFIARTSQDPDGRAKAFIEYISHAQEFEYAGLLVTAENLGIAEPARNYMGKRLEDAFLARGAPKAWELQQLCRSFQSINYIPQDPELFAKIVLDTIPESPSSFHATARVEDIAWIVKGAARHDLTNETNARLEAFYQRHVSGPPKYSFDVHYELPTMRAIQQSLNLPEEPLVKWARHGLGQAARDDDGYNCLNLTQDFSRHLPQLAAEARDIFKANAERWWPDPKHRELFLSRAAEARAN